MNIDKRVLYTIIGCFIVLITITVISLTIAFRPIPIVDFNKDQFDLIYDKLDQVESNLIINQNIIQKEIDSLEHNKEEATLIWNSIKHSDQMKQRIKELKNEKYENYKKKCDYEREAVSDSN